MEETNKQPSFKKRIGRSTLIILVNIAAMVAIVCVLSFWYMPSRLHDITGHDERIVIMNVVGMDADDAVEKLQAQGVVPQVIDTIFSDGHKPGVVLDQLPEGNLPVKPGRYVYLTINSYTTQMFTLPDVIDHSNRQARSELEDQFFVVDSVRYQPYEFDELVLEVVSSADGKQMKAGQEYPKRTHVVMVVGSTTVEVEARNEESENDFFN